MILNFIRNLKFEKTLNITFNKELYILKEYLVQKNKKRIQSNYPQQLIFKDILDPLIRKQ